MKNMYFLLLIGSVLAADQLSAQQVPPVIRFKNGDFAAARNPQKGRELASQLRLTRFEKKYYPLIHFSTLPGDQQKKELAAGGIKLYDYYPGNAYLAEVSDSLSSDMARKYHINGVYPVSRQFKLSAALLENLANSSPISSKLLSVSFFGSISKQRVGEEITRLGGQLVSTKIQPDHALFINAPAGALVKIAALPFITAITEQSLQDVPLNYNNHAAYSLDALCEITGRNLFGKNVTVGVGDDSDPSTHIDFAGRLINRTPAPPNVHGSHTTGTTGGGGILNPMYRGMAPKSTLISQYYSDILVNAETYIHDYNMVLTNNSYYSGNAGCAGEGQYDVLSNYVDAQQNAHTSLLDVFASGNDGSLTCQPYPAYFGTVKSGYQCGKNVLTVGADTNTNHIIWHYSSRGPVADGRIKPEIIAGGVGIISTYAYNIYGSDNGTSMACPTVTGTLALLYERYRQLHGGADPAASLIKAVACNGADDLGNPGPDYTYGFGRINARTAVEALEKNQYFTGTLSDGGNSSFSLSTVPAGAYQVKIMLYWSDPAAAPNAGAALVNDLDLTVTGSDGVPHHPLILNPAAGHVNDPATEGVDHINNIEQVVISNPPAGNLAITVNGTHIPSGPQDFVVVYQVITPSVVVEYPFGSETWVPAQTEKIRWNAYGGSGNGFTIEYSSDQGMSWSLLSNSVADSLRSFAWTLPPAPTTQGLIRVTRNNAGLSGTSHSPFTILGQPVITLTKPCQGYAQLTWNAIPGAGSYQIMKLHVDSMQAIASTTDTSFLLQGLNRDSTYWLTVRAVLGNTPGRRAVAASIIPNSGPCTLFTNDFMTDSLVSPVNGRQYTSSSLGSSTHLNVELKNGGSLPSSAPFQVSFQVNGGPVVSESSASVVAAGASYVYQFNTPYDFSAPGSYQLKIWVDYPGDTLHANDTLLATVRQLSNDTLLLNPSFREGFESASPASYGNGQVGLGGLDRFDFRASDGFGRLRTFVNTGFARSGQRCGTLDRNSYSSSASADSLVGTFNLSNCLPTDQIWLDFYYKNQGINFTLPGNQVWIRGNDQAAWIPVLNLSTDPSLIGQYQPSGAIDVTGLLASAQPSQQVSSSFQVKFGEQGYTSSNSVIPDGTLDNGYSFDDLTISRPTNDLGLIALVTPGLSNICGLGNAEVISVKVRNYSKNTLSNIPVSYAINGQVVNETIPSLQGLDSLVYTFTRTADLSAYGGYTIRAWVSYPGDNYPNNDSLPAIRFQTTPVIASFPYLEGFENSNGYWFTNGINDSWQWGIPNKTIINHAANGTRAWVTNLNGNYNNNELSYLYSPCFDLSILQAPVFSFSHIFQTEDDCDCDYHWVEYSLNDSVWIKLGAVAGGTNWYDNSTRQSWQHSDTLWHVSSYDVPSHSSKVRFRIVMSSDPATNYEGIGIDDIHIFDKAPVYNGPSLDGGLTQNLSGSAWVDFASGGTLVASINPNGQNLGSTAVRVFRNDSLSVRHTLNQYYLDRNIVIQPAVQPTDSVSVRFYFTDSEALRLIQATGCTSCSSLHDAYQSGITQYSLAPSEEDSTLTNNMHGIYGFILPHQQVSVIPHDNGYYAEFKVARFSEFWINGGGITQDQSLGTVLQTFTATLVDSSALLQWSTLHQSGLDSFVIEKSTDSVVFIRLSAVAALQSGGDVLSYQYRDTSLSKGVNYYRLIILHKDSSIQYSPVRWVLYNPQQFIKGIYPNPVTKGSLYINTSGNCNSVEVMDVSGRVIRSIRTAGTQQTISMAGLSKGIYLVVVLTDGGRQVAKILVE